MSLIKFLPWLFPIGLFILLAYRWLSNGPISSKSPLRYVFWFILAFSFGLIIFQYGEYHGRSVILSTKEDKKPVMDTVAEISKVTPEILADMVNKDENYISSIFYDYKYKRVVEVADGNIILYKYVLLKPHFADPQIEDNVAEYAFIQSNIPGQIFYVMKAHDDFDKFIDSLKKIGESVNVEIYPGGKDLLGKYFGFRYKDCVFSSYSERGFASDYMGYFIKAVDLKLALKPIPRNSNSNRLRKDKDGFIDLSDIKRNPDGSVDFSQ